MVKGDSDTVELLASRRPGNNEVDAYERVLTDAMSGDRTLFAREDYIEEAWRIVDPVVKAGTQLYEYDAGTWGPKEVARITPAGRLAQSDRRMNIRAATHEDLAAVLALVPRLSATGVPPGRDAAQVEASDTQSIARALTQTSAGEALLIAEETGELLGLVHIKTVVDYFSQQPIAHVRTWWWQRAPRDAESAKP